MKKKYHRPDYHFLGAVLILLLFGLVVLTSASSVVGLQKFGDSYFFVKRQLLYGVFPGIFALYLFARLDFHILRKFSFFIFLGIIAMLLLTFIPGIGASFGTGAKSWISFGNYSLQPSEFAKLAIIIFLATHISQLGSVLQNLKKGFLVTLGLGILPILLVIFQPDIGTVFILSGILYAMLFLGHAKYSHMFVLSLVGIVLFFVMVWVEPYRVARFTTFLHPEFDSLGQGYHINQAFLAIGSGGLFGLGLGHSRQKFAYLPEVHADSIYAVMAEELGFFVSVAFLFLLFYIVFRGFRIAKKSPDTFGRLLVSGILVWFVIQSFLNICGMLGLLPLTGVPLPFVSHGGTALIALLASVGVVLNVSKQTNIN